MRAKLSGMQENMFGFLLLERKEKEKKSFFSSRLKGSRFIQQDDYCLGIKYIRTT